MRSAQRTTLAFAAVLAAAAGASVALAEPRVQATRGVLVIETNLDYQGSAAAGTGMVIGAGGEVLTNNHVIRGATSIRAVDPRTGRRFPASVVGYDIADDVAVLKLTGASGLTTVSLGNSATVRRGQPVAAVGNAGGTGRLASAVGTVTALGRGITVQDDQGGTERLRGLLQTNARLQPGDSGGPLLDGSGRVIGIDTAASAGFSFRLGASEGYAIPIDRALTLARKIEQGRASSTVHIGATAFLGVSVQPADYASAAGALVGQVVPGGPADRAGLAAGDVITAIDGHAVSSPGALVPLLQRKKPGDSLGLTWSDQFGNQRTAAARLASGPPQ